MDAGAEAKGETLDADLPPGSYVTTPVGNDARRGGTKLRIREWLKIRAVEPLITASDAAVRMGVSSRTLYRDIATATKEGWLRFEDPVERIDFQIIPKTLDNLNRFLDERDKTVTIETAKATIFKTYQNAKGVSDGGTMILALKIEQPEEENPRIITGHIIGKPKVITE